MRRVKPKGAARDTGRSEIAPAEAMSTEIAPTIAPEAPAHPKAASPPPAPVPAPVAEVVALPSAMIPEAVPHIVALPPAMIPEVAPQTFAVPPEHAVASSDDAWTAFAEAQAAFARSVEEIATEVSGMTRSGIAAASDAAVALIGARTFAEAVEINAGLARLGVDAMIAGSARLSDIGAKAVTEASQPILSRLGATWSGPGIGG